GHPAELKLGCSMVNNVLLDLDLEKPKGTQHMVKERHTKVENISWYPPQHGWMRLNTDGVSKTGTRLTGCGGVLRDATFESSSENGGQKLEVQVDSSMVVDGVQLEKAESAKGWSIVNKINAT
ncbi:hypothetical protein L195_g041484, partial [Trifolium pratense]